MGFCKVLALVLVLLALFGVSSVDGDDKVHKEEKQEHKHAYATMMYMGTPRDYEFYVAMRVMLRSLSNLKVQADLVVIASLDVPLSWVEALEKEDGAKVVRVPNMDNPYKQQISTNRFKLTLNKLYAWSLTKYDRVVMLDDDNLFLQKTDELFQCGEFCAAFINPCIFHTGLFVLKPSMEVFNDMRHKVEIWRHSYDAFDQGFLTSYFPDLLDAPMFYAPVNGTKLKGNYRLPLGYQMDASLFYLKLHWSIPCGPNSVITFPSAPWLKPWYWWAWPVLPLGLQWHEQRLQTLGYEAEMPMVVIQLTLCLVVIAVTRLTRPNLTKLCHRHPDHKNIFFYQMGLKMAVMLSILAAYIIPLLLIPTTLHPVLGWFLYLFGSSALSFFVINAFLLPTIHVLMPWLSICGALMVMAYPWYNNGITRILALSFYSFCISPLIWGSLVKVIVGLQLPIERENILPRLGESTQLLGINKLY